MDVTQVKRVRFETEAEPLEHCQNTEQNDKKPANPLKLNEFIIGLSGCSSAGKTSTAVLLSVVLEKALGLAPGPYSLKCSGTPHNNVPDPHCEVVHMDECFIPYDTAFSPEQQPAIPNHPTASFVPKPEDLHIIPGADTKAPVRTPDRDHPEAINWFEFQRRTTTAAAEVKFTYPDSTDPRSTTTTASFISDPPTTQRTPAQIRSRTALVAHHSSPPYTQSTICSATDRFQIKIRDLLTDELLRVKDLKFRNRRLARQRRRREESDNSNKTEEEEEKGASHPKWNESTYRYLDNLLDALEQGRLGRMILGSSTGDDDEDDDDKKRLLIVEGSMVLGDISSLPLPTPLPPYPGPPSSNSNTPIPTPCSSSGGSSSNSSSKEEQVQTKTQEEEEEEMCSSSVVVVPSRRRRLLQAQETLSSFQSRIHVPLFLPLGSLEEASGRRFRRDEFRDFVENDGDEKKTTQESDEKGEVKDEGGRGGLRKVGQLWKTRGYFEEVGWPNYQHFHRHILSLSRQQHSHHQEEQQQQQIRGGVVTEKKKKSEEEEEEDKIKIHIRPEHLAGDPSSSSIRDTLNWAVDIVAGVLAEKLIRLSRNIQQQY